MKLIVGLGNPGKKYLNTRHNVGFVVVDKLVEQLRVAGHEFRENWKESKSGNLLYIRAGNNIEIIKPQTFVNDSGESVMAVRRKHQNLEVEDIFVVHDDLDIRLGEFKIQKGKGPRGHNGLQSIYEKLGTKNFWHVRVGIENRGSDQVSGEDYVLEEFSSEEQAIIAKMMDKVAHEVIKKLDSN